VMAEKAGEYESPDFDRHCASCGKVHGPVNAWIVCLTACVKRLKREAEAGAGAPVDSSIRLSG
jgi:hypothetical protein